MPVRRVQISVSSPAQTRALARCLGRAARSGDVVALIGGLGTGKTVFAQSFGRSLGVRGRLTSPTFVVSAQHSLRARSIRRFYHFDLYRTKRLSTEDAELLREAVADRRGVTVVEWADRARHPLARAARARLTTVRLRIAGFQARRITVSGKLSQSAKARQR